MKKFQFGFVAAALVAGFVGGAQAATIDSISKGAVFVGNPGSPGAYGQIQNVILLAYGNLGNQSSFLVFDPSALGLGAENVASATLTLTGFGFFSASPAANTVNLYDFGGAGYTGQNLLDYGRVGGPGPQPTAAAAAAIRDDLRSGDIYGSASVPPAGTFKFDLNAAAVADLNTAIDNHTLFVVGLWSPTQTSGYLFLSSGAAVGHLSVEPTPVPGAAVLMGSVLAGGAGFGAWRRRRKAAQA